MIKDEFLGESKIHFHEEGEKLTKDETFKDTEFSQSVTYGKVEYVEVQADSYRPGARKRTVMIESPEGFMAATFLSEAEARAVAEYVARKSSLELIGGAWRVRRAFHCPDDSGLGCESFKEMLDHDDPDIVDSFYDRSPTSHDFACFNQTGNRFFILSYTHLEYAKSGYFRKQTFESGQAASLAIGKVQWMSDDLANISPLEAPPEGPKAREPRYHRRGVAWVSREVYQSNGHRDVIHTRC